jgi:hypothetical protein
VSFLPVFIRLASASVRIIPATAIVGFLGYLGLETLRKYFDPKPEKWEDYDLFKEAEKNRKKYEKGGEEK